MMFSKNSSQTLPDLLQRKKQHLQTLIIDRKQQLHDSTSQACYTFGTPIIIHTEKSTVELTFTPILNLAALKIFV